MIEWIILHIRALWETVVDQKQSAHKTRYRVLINFDDSVAEPCRFLRRKKNSNGCRWTTIDDDRRRGNANLKRQWDDNVNSKGEKIIIFTVNFML